MRRFLAIITATFVLVGLAVLVIVEAPVSRERQREVIARHPGRQSPARDGDRRVARPVRSGPPGGPAPEAALHLRPAGVRHVPARRRLAAVRGREDGAHPRHQERRPPEHALPRHLEPGLDRRRAGPALHGVRPALRDQRALLRRLHQRERRHARRALHGLEGRPERGGRRQRPHHPPRPPALLQPQRGTVAVRPRRAPLRRPRRRRQRRRSQPLRAEPLDPALQDPAPQRQRVAGEGAEVRDGPAEPLALLVRQQDGSAVDRRRRSGQVGGGRLPEAGRSGRRQLRAGAPTRARTSTTAPSPRP